MGTNLTASGSRRGPRCGTALVVATVLAVIGTVVATPHRADAQEPEKVIEVFAIGGQSNAAGQRVETVEQLFEEIIGPDTENRSIAVVKSGSQGTSITGPWRGDGTASTEADGYNYLAFQEKVHQFIADLQADNPDHQVRFAGMWWHQGEGDSRPEYAVEYEQNLNTLLQDIRVTFEVPDLVVVIARLHHRANDGWLTVREAQLGVGNRDLNAYTVDLDDMAPYVTSGVHYTTQGYAEIAKKFVTTYAEVTRDWPTCGTYLVEPGECVQIAAWPDCDQDQPVIVAEATTLADRSATVNLAVDGSSVDDAGVGVEAQAPVSVSTGPVQPGSRRVVVTGNDAVVYDQTVQVLECDFVLGDVDDSDTLDLADVAALLDLLAGKPGPSHSHRGDIDDSGTIDLRDAMLLAQAVTDPDPS